MSLTLSKKTRKGWGIDDTGGKKNSPCPANVHQEEVCTLTL